jgi:hypothetical protein
MAAADLVEGDRSALAALWPPASIPVLVDNGVVISQSSIIVEHLDRHGDAPPLIPTHRNDALQARLWDRVADGYITTPVQTIVGDALRPRGAKDPHGVSHAHATVDLAYATLDRQLDGRDDEGRLAGDHFTLADCAAQRHIPTSLPSTQAIRMLCGRVVPDHLAQKVSQLTLLVRGETLKAAGRLPDTGQHPFAQPPAGCGKDDMLDAPVLGARLAGDEPPRLEPVNEPGDVGVVAGEERGELGHRHRRVQLKKSSRLRRVEVKLSGGDEKPAPVLSKESAKQFPDLSRRLHLADGRGRLHPRDSIESLDR